MRLKWIEENTLSYIKEMLRLEKVSDERFTKGAICLLRNNPGFVKSIPLPSLFNLFITYSVMIF